jgi:glycosyltransferase involved in cell wall biosynthesis
MRVAMFLGYAPDFGRMWSDAARTVADVVEIREVVAPSPGAQPTATRHLFQHSHERNGTTSPEYQIVVEQRSPERLWGPALQRLNARRITRALREIERLHGPIDVTHGHFYSSVINVAHTDWPVVFTEHSSLFGRVAVADTVGASERRSLAAASDVYRRVARPIAISAQQRALIAEYLPGSTPALIHNPVMVSRPVTTPDQSKTDEFSIVTLGRLSRTKRHDVMFDAVHSLRNEGLKLRLDVYGSGELEPGLRSQLDRLGLTECVTLRGGVDRDSALDAIRSSDALLTTSDVESFGLPNVEALLSGTPVCSTPVGFAAEMTSLDGAVIADGTSVADVVGALRLLVERRPTVTVGDRSWLHDRVSTEAVASQLASLYTEVS